MATYVFEDVILIGFSVEKLLTLSIMMQMEAIKSNFFEALETLISLIGVAN